MTASSSKNANILVVDDESDMRALLKFELEMEGYYVQTAGDGVQALEHMLACEFDVIVSDVQMPRMDGTELLKKVKEQAPNTEVIIATAFADLQVALLCVRSGAYDLIQK